MCGIVGYVGGQDAVPVILDGLKRLEYRGYDSAGVAVVNQGSLQRRRSAGKLDRLASSLAAEPLRGEWGLGHTRWATHGRPTEENAHPHQDCGGHIVVVHNGIIENHLELKERLVEEGHRFVTQTDTEVLAHLVESAYRGSLEEAAREALARVRGVYALVLLHRDEPQRLVAARMGPPLVIGVGESEHFIASDIPALLRHTRDFVFLEDGDVATVTPTALSVRNLEGVEVTRPPQRVTWDPVQAEKGGYRHFMLKEIHEQPRAARDTLLGRFSVEDGEVLLDELGPAAAGLREASRVMLLACGTSWHAGLVGKFLIEHLAGLPAEVDYGSEFRYRTPLVGPGTVAVAISQSGETADTLAAFREAKSRGALPIAICNVRGSMLTREAVGSLLTHAGPEIGVASTKAFTSQLVALALLALHLGRLRGTLSPDQCREHLVALARIPHLMEQALSRADEIEELTRSLTHATDFLYLGRGINYPIALEGALKLKEISYVHAEGYPAGEMKHGPIALIDDALPVVALCADDHVYEKMLSNIQEAKARGGRVIAVAPSGNGDLRGLLDGPGDAILEIPSCPALWSPFITVLPLQLLAYHVALRAGRDVDQPRNLAKSVTVE
ncbi:MAG: glutamine--fructose-6-phosphate transaminase (isomerizing) [Acidobacteria bacterium]|jgi:glucosamine--fructose-6-phosphate aminotransferase (isomerizing)|nr:glutamine--fructose-6-phosphate transaminase (isomerizing) [Acidobacteriota bacterium]